jgi:hypothetical protein
MRGDQLPAGNNPQAQPQIAPQSPFTKPQPQADQQ